MAAKTGSVATNTAAGDKATRKRGPRKPSAFTPKIRVVIQSHKEVDAPTAIALGEQLKGVLSNDFAVKAVSRHRAGAKGTGPTALSIYLAPKGYTFPTVTTTERGVRIPADVANVLRSLAQKMNLDASDPKVLADIAKSLAESAAKKV